MSASFEELDYQQTELGELILRRRRPVGLIDTEVYEVKLAGRFLMSSLVTDSERALARLVLEKVEGSGLHVLIGGLGLGYTAAEALDDGRVSRLDVVERLAAVIDWHRRGLVPLATRLCTEARCHLIHGDCFDLLRRAGPESYDAILLDIDDSPIHLLDPGHAAFYTVEGLQDAARCLSPRGVFGLWTSLPAEPEVLELLARSFGQATAEEVCFGNPLLDAPETNAIYLAGKPIT